jgi:hypothetical protein
MRAKVLFAASEISGAWLLSLLVTVTEHDHFALGLNQSIAIDTIEQCSPMLYKVSQAGKTSRCPGCGYCLILLPSLRLMSSPSTSV